MALDLDFNFDLKEDTPEKLDSGGRVEPGWYPARLDDVHKDDEKDCLIFTFVIQGGPFDGGKQWYRIYDPDQAEDESKRLRAMQRIKMLASRLLLVKEDDCGKEEVSGNWMQAIGRDYVIQVTKDKNNYVGIDYAGVYPPNHKSVPKEIRMGDADTFQAVEAGKSSAGSGKSATKPARATSATAVATKPGLSLDDL